jgi:hypothetical protein
MELEVRTNDGVLTVKMRGDVALGYYRQFATDKSFNKTTKNIVGKGIIDCFTVKTDIKIVLGEVEIWLLEGYYVKITV